MGFQLYKNKRINFENSKKGEKIKKKSLIHLAPNQNRNELIHTRAICTGAQLFQTQNDGIKYTPFKLLVQSGHGVPKN